MADTGRLVALSGTPDVCFCRIISPRVRLDSLAWSLGCLLDLTDPIRAKALHGRLWTTLSCPPSVLSRGTVFSPSSCSSGDLCLSAGLLQTTLEKSMLGWVQSGTFTPGAQASESTCMLYFFQLEDPGSSGIADFGRSLMSCSLPWPWKQRLGAFWLRSISSCSSRLASSPLGALRRLRCGM